MSDEGTIHSKFLASNVIAEHYRYEQALEEIKQLADELVARGPAPFSAARIANVAREALDQSRGRSAPN